jgi:hypothetical protein
MLRFNIFGAEYIVLLHGGRMISGIKKVKNTTITFTGDGFINENISSINDEPAVVFANGERTRYMWVERGVAHRINGPAIIKKRNGVVYCEQWKRKGKLHNANGPAVIYYLRGRPVRKLWYKWNRYLGSKLNFEGLSENECAEVARLHPRLETSLWK